METIFSFPTPGHSRIAFSSLAFNMRCRIRRRGSTCDFHRLYVAIAKPIEEAMPPNSLKATAPRACGCRLRRMETIFSFPTPGHSRIACSSLAFDMRCRIRRRGSTRDLHRLHVAIATLTESASAPLKQTIPGPRLSTAQARVVQRHVYKLARAARLMAPPLTQTCQSTARRCSNRACPAHRTASRRSPAGTASPDRQTRARPRGSTPRCCPARPAA